MAQGAAGVLVHSSMAPGSQSSLWHFLGSDPLEPAAVLEISRTSQSSLSYPQKHDFAKFWFCCAKVMCRIPKRWSTPYALQSLPQDAHSPQVHTGPIRSWALLSLWQKKLRQGKPADSADGMTSRCAVVRKSACSDSLQNPIVDCRTPKEFQTHCVCIQPDNVWVPCVFFLTVKQRRKVLA